MNSIATLVRTRRLQVIGVLIAAILTVVVFCFLLALSSSPTDALTNLVTWTSQADFETNASTTGTPTTRVNVDTSSQPGNIKLAPLDLDTGTGADGELVVDGTVGSNSTDGQVHDANNPYVINGSKNYTNVTVQSGGVVTHDLEAGAGTDVEGMELKVTGTLSMDATSKIEVTGKGYSPQTDSVSTPYHNAEAGPGSGYNDFGGGAGGGAYGGNGGPGGFQITPAPGGTSCGTPSEVEYMGSGGGNTVTTSGVAGYGGGGGGRVRIVATIINIEGGIQANGTGGKLDSSNNHQNGAGGGSGGGIYLAASTVSMSGYLSAAGGGGGAANLLGQAGTNGSGGNGADATNYWTGEFIASGGLGGMPGLAGNGGHGGSSFWTVGNGGPSAGGGGAGGSCPPIPGCYGGGGGGAGRIAIYYQTYNGGLVNSGNTGYASSPGGTVGPYAYHTHISDPLYHPQGILGGKGSQSVGLQFDTGEGQRAKWVSLDWDAEVLAPEQNIQFQIRAANTLESLSKASYIGYDATTTTWFDSDHKVIPDSVLASRYIEIQVKLTSGPFSTPVLHSVTLDYESVSIATKDCAGCHANYPSDNFDSHSEATPANLNACSSCHVGPNIPSHSTVLYKTPYGWFRNAESINLNNPATISEIHTKHRSHVSSYCSGGAGCHQGTACTRCHNDPQVPHRNHAESQYPGITETYASGTLTLPCTNSLCHGSLNLGFTARPDCYNCHPVSKEGHGDISELHLSTEPTPNCIGSGCHYSNYLTTEHENQGYPCDICHTYDGTKLDPVKVREAIDTGNTDCSACHPDAGDHYQAHEAEPPLDSGLYGTNSCDWCHLNNLQDEHPRHKDAYGNNLTCDTCHDAPPGSDVQNAIYLGNTNCDACHTIHGNIIAIHESPSSQYDTGCDQCHASNIGTEHDQHNLGCSGSGCHDYTGTELDPAKVSEAIAGHDTSCSGCHEVIDHEAHAQDAYPFNSGNGWTGAKTICAKCHANKQSHMDEKDKQDCGRCHRPGKKKSIHLLTYVHMTYCGECHTGAPKYVSDVCSGCHPLSDWRKYP